MWLAGAMARAFARHAPERQVALATTPAFVEKLLWGKKVVGLRITLAKAKPKVVERLLAQSWARKAPRNLVARH